MSQPDLQAILAAHRKIFAKGAPTYEQRMKALATLRDALHDHQDALIEAVNKDFGRRSREETRTLELFPLYALIQHTRRHLKRWMRRKRVPSSWYLRPGRAYYQYQPLGVVGIMGAWNYPIMLTIGPLIDVIAAGNHAMIKPSELAPNTAEVLARMIELNFDRDYITVVNGDVEMAKAFSAIPFDHLLFTGSTRTGTLVMQAAAKNLTPVTLELGGKSPAIVHQEYNIRKAAERIMTGKLYNAGQTCIAPDYVMVHESKVEAFQQAAEAIVKQRYPEGIHAPDYTEIISRGHLDRLTQLQQQAERLGARAITLHGNQTSPPEQTLYPPTLLLNVNEHMDIMKEEIFGPILPVLTYTNLSEAIEYVNNHERPLALYYFDTNRKRINELMHKTWAGGVTINDCILHIAQHHLPFGGVGQSGIGHYHGFDGFVTFSKKKPVMVQHPLSATSILSPPFTDLKRRLVDTLLYLARR